MSSSKKAEFQKLFNKSISRILMQFLDPILEIKFLKERNKINQHYKIVIILSAFSFFLIGVRLFSSHFLSIFEISQMTNKTNFILYIGILDLFGIMLEILPIFIYKLRYFKGMFVTFIPLMIGTYQSYFYCVESSLNNPMFYPIFLALALMSIPVSLIYTYNWICGEILITIQCVIIEIFLCIYNWEFLDKIFVSVLIITTYISLGTCLRFLEYLRRENFFKTYLANKQNKDTQNILRKLPDPIIITEEKEITFINTAYANIANEAFTSRLTSHVVEEMKQENEIVGTQNPLIDKNIKLAERIINNSNHKTLKNYITSEREINDDNQFNLLVNENKKPIPFEIKSTEVNYSGKLQIVYSLKNLGALFELNELKAKERYSSMFVASVSHDFRTPINIISGNIESIELYEKVDPNLLDYVENIKIASLYLEVMVQDLIDYSRMKEKKFNIIPALINIVKPVEDAMALLKSKYLDKNIEMKLELNVDPDFTFLSDPMRIKQILVNFLSNAWKFTVEGKVLVNISLDSSKEFILISVNDSGIGIDPEDIPKLMKPFSKLEDKFHLNENGIGLGLNICKKLAKRIGGKIIIESKVGIGSSFTLSLNINFFQNNKETIRVQRFNPSALSPIRDPIEEDKDERFTSPKNFLFKNLSPHNKYLYSDSSRAINKKPLIIIADDESGNRKVLLSYLKKFNLLCFEAKNGQEALDLVKSNISPNRKDENVLIFMDSNMPIMNGEESSIKIRDYLKEMGAYPPIIICVTANAEAQQKGPLDDIYDDIVYKPLKFDTFKLILKNFINI